MDEKKELEGLQEGDKVWSPIYGEGTIKDIDDNPTDLPYRVEAMGGEKSVWVTLEGNRDTEEMPCFFRNEESFRDYWNLCVLDSSPKAPCINPEVLEDMMDATDSIQEEVQKMIVADRAFRCAGQNLTGDLIGNFAHAIDSHRYNLHKEIRNLKKENEDESN